MMKLFKGKRLSFVIIYILAIVMFLSCHRKHTVRPAFYKIDSLLETFSNTDSAANLLVGLSEKQEELSEEETAFYFLLRTKLDTRLNMVKSDSMIRAVVNYYEKTGNNDLLAKAYLYRGKVSKKLEEDSIALIYYMKAEGKAKLINDSILLKEIHDGMGYVYLMQLLAEEAIREFKTAYHYLDKKRRQSSYYKFYFWRNMARGYNLKRILSSGDKREINADSAVLFYKKALSVTCDEIPEDEYRTVNRDLALIYSDKKQYTEALRYLEAGIDSSDLYFYYTKKAWIYQSMSQFDSSYVYLLKNIADTNNNNKNSAIYDLLFHLEKKRGNYEKALNYVDTFLTLNEQEFRNVVPEKIMEIQRKYNNEKLRAEKAELEFEYERERSRSLAVLLVAVLSVFTAGCIYIYGYLKRKRLHRFLLEQENELLKLIQKAQSWSQQIKISQEKIKQLEQERREINDNLNLMSREKEEMLRERERELAYYREQENEISARKVQYEELCFVEFKKLFLTTPLAKKLPVFGTDKIVTDKMSEEMQRQLMQVMDEVCCDFASRVYVLTQKSIDKTCLCCLLKLQVKPKYIMILCGLSKEAYYKQCQRIAESLLGKNSASALKRYLETF